MNEYEKDDLSASGQIDERISAGADGHYYGVYTAQVIDNADPLGQGRVRIRLPWSPDNEGASYEAWARLATMMAGDNRGTWFIPDVGDEVLVAFEAGEPSRPHIVGALWNGQDAPPESMDAAGGNILKTICSRNGVRITLDDTDGQESLTMETPGGQSLTLRDGPGTVEIVDNNGNSVRLEPGGITVNAPAQVKISATTVDVSAGMVTVNAGLTQFSGVVLADVVFCNSIIGPSYSP